MYTSIIFAATAFVFALLFALLIALPSRSAAVRTGEKKLADAEKKLKDAAAREFEGAKPALIHACDTTIDVLPDTVDLSALEAKALITLTALLKRLLLANPLLGSAGMLLISLLPMAFSALPKTLDAASYKGLLKEEVAKIIGGAQL